LHAHHGAVDWSGFFARCGARKIPVPTYAFQRRRYWLTPSPQANGGGFARGGHPILTGTTDLPGTGTHIFTGQVSLNSHPWLADHAVNGDPLLPGTALLDLALHAG